MMNLEKEKTVKDKYKQYLEITSNLDNSPRMVELKKAIWKHIFKRSDDYGKKVKLFTTKRI